MSWHFSICIISGVNFGSWSSPIHNAVHLWTNNDVIVKCSYLKWNFQITKWHFMTFPIPGNSDILVWDARTYVELCVCIKYKYKIIDVGTMYSHATEHIFLFFLLSDLQARDHAGRISQIVWEICILNSKKCVSIFPLARLNYDVRPAHAAVCLHLERTRTDDWQIWGNNKKVFVENIPNLFKCLE